MQPRRTLVVAVLTAAIVGSLVGCTGTPIDTVVQGSLDQARGEVEGLVSDALGGAELTTDGTLPSSFPSEVPLVTGTVLGGGASPDSSGWVARVEVSSAGQFAEAQSLLEEAGFDGAGISTDASSGFGNFASDAYNVVLTVATDSAAADAVVATYVVTPR